MDTGQRETGRTVVEPGIVPVVGRVTKAAVLGKPRGHVIGAGRAGEVRGVAAEAIRGNSRKSTPGMAVHTTDPSVHSCQREAGQVMIEPGSEPAVHPMATLASRRKLRRQVIRGLCSLKIGKVTRRTGGAESPEQADSRIRVARFAADGGMGAHERKSILVIVDRLQ